MRAVTVVQIFCARNCKKLCKSCKTCFMFYCMFYFTCDRRFTFGGRSEKRRRPLCRYGLATDINSKIIINYTIIELKYCGICSTRVRPIWAHKQAPKRPQIYDFFRHSPMATNVVVDRAVVVVVRFSMH